METASAASGVRLTGLLAEAGKGFAVVAGEVKELAKQTARATEDIGRKVVAIQADTGGAVTAIAQITSIINQIHDIETTIASAVEEQAATTSEIGRNVSEAARASTEIAGTISGVATAAQSTADGVGQTQSASGELSRMAEELRGLVAEFQVSGEEASRQPPRRSGSEGRPAPSAPRVEVAIGAPRRGLSAAPNGHRNGHANGHARNGSAR